MKLDMRYGVMLMTVFLSPSIFIHADEHDGSGQGVQTAIEQHELNIENFTAENPDKDIPKGMLHSIAVLERIHIGERPELPDMASARPELTDVASFRFTRPARPSTGRP